MSRIIQVAWLLAASVAWLGCSRPEPGSRPPVQKGAADSKPGDNTYTVEWTEYSPPPQRPDGVLADDRLEEKNPPFDETVIDSRPLGDWELNASAAVIRLDCPIIKPDVEAELLTLRRSYAEAMRPEAVGGRDFLAQCEPPGRRGEAVRRRAVRGGRSGLLPGRVGLRAGRARRDAAIFDRQPAKSPRAAATGRGLGIGGTEGAVAARRGAAQSKCCCGHSRPTSPAASPSASTIGPRSWRRSGGSIVSSRRSSTNATSAPCRAVAAALADDPKLLARYRVVNALYGRLTNPLACLSADALVGAAGDLDALAKRQGVQRPTIAVLPPSTSRETELFNRLFPQGVPAEVDLMATLIRRIRAGEVDLKPGDKDGWYPGLFEGSPSPSGGRRTYGN